MTTTCIAHPYAVFHQIWRESGTTTLHRSVPRSYFAEELFTRRSCFTEYEEVHIEYDVLEEWEVCQQHPRIRRYVIASITRDITCKMLVLLLGIDFNRVTALSSWLALNTEILIPEETGPSWKTSKHCQINIPLSLHYRHGSISLDWFIPQYCRTMTT